MLKKSNKNIKAVFKAAASRSEGDWSQKRPKSPYEFLLEKWRMFENEMARTRASQDGPLRWRARVGQTKQISTPNKPAPSPVTEEIPKIFQNNARPNDNKCILFKELEKKSNVTSPKNLISQTLTPKAPTNQNITQASALFPEFNNLTTIMRESIKEGEKTLATAQTLFNAPSQKQMRSIAQVQRKGISTIPGRDKNLRKYHYDRVSPAIKSNHLKVNMKPSMYVKPVKSMKTTDSMKSPLISNERHQSNSTNSTSKHFINRSKSSDAAAYLLFNNQNKINQLKQSNKRSQSHLASAIDLFRKTDMINPPQSKEAQSAQRKEARSEQIKAQSATATDLFGDTQENKNTAKAEKTESQSERPAVDSLKHQESVRDSNQTIADPPFTLYDEQDAFTTQMDAVKSQFHQLDSLCRECTAFYPIRHSPQSLPTPTVDAITELRRRLAMKGPMCIETPLVSIFKMTSPSTSYCFSYNKEYRS